MKIYKMIREIGRGGFGYVEEVELSTGERFARKTFGPGAHVPRSAYDNLRRRFRREVKIQEELGGPNVMPVLASNLDTDEPWFAMPLAARTYEQQIQDDRTAGSVDIDAVADILNDLQFLHDLGYVHRDLNPKNILRHEEKWKLSDLGAVLPPSGSTQTLTEDTVIYTERYCSPEQRNEFHKSQSSADIYSLGCILHDIFGTSTRTPYHQHSAPGPVGPIIEKCTELKPSRRPTVKVLRQLLLETLVEIGGHCTVDDKEAESWLKRLDDIEKWTEEEYSEFARFFAALDIMERTAGNEHGWIYSLSTPFLTRLPANALKKIVERKDGISAAIVEKFCEWARNTSFLFFFADTVCERLSAIFDHGTIADKAQALIAMIELGYSHNRWYVMREMLRRCSGDNLTKEIAKRFQIEVRTEEMESHFIRCVKGANWNETELAPELQKLCS